MVSLGSGSPGTRSLHAAANTGSHSYTAVFTPALSSNDVGSSSAALPYTVQVPTPTDLGDTTPPTLTFSPLFHVDKGSLSGMAVNDDRADVQPPAHAHVSASVEQVGRSHQRGGEDRASHS